MPDGKITVIAGVCSAVVKADVFDMGYKLHRMQPVVKPYKIMLEERAGAYKPRTESQNNGKRIFEGVGPIGLQWLGDAAREFNMPVATEIMYAGDLPHFFHSLDPLRDTAWIGARDNQNYALLAFLGLAPFHVMIKNPLHGVLPVQAKGSFDRITHPTTDENIVAEYNHLVRSYPNGKLPNTNRRLVYCIRGQEWPIGPDGRVDERQREITLERPHQYRSARNVNNIESVTVLREHSYFQEHGIQIFFDPSHIFGGTGDARVGITPNQTRKLIGEYAVRAVTEFGYDGLLIEVHDKSRTAKTDKDQALVTTYNGIDYTETNMGQKPSDDERPLSLVDILKKLMAHQVLSRRVDIPPEKLTADQKALDDLVRWDMAA